MELSSFIEQMEERGHRVECHGEGRYSTVSVDGELYGQIVGDRVVKGPMEA